MTIVGSRVERLVESRGKGVDDDSWAVTRRESYVAYNPASSQCNGLDPEYCIEGESCNGQGCICLFDNPFLGLRDTKLAGRW